MTGISRKLPVRFAQHPANVDVRRDDAAILFFGDPAQIARIAPKTNAISSAQAFLTQMLGAA